MSDIIEKNKDLSSAELTANYRCAFSELSGDNISHYLSSVAGRELAKDFISKYNYPLARRKISVCAGYFLKEASRLIKTDRYDSVISFASGFSLLVYLIAKNNLVSPNFTFYDTDLPHMIEERNKRIELAKDKLDIKILARLKSKSLDIEQIYKEKQTLKDIFPDCKRPIFILDGVSYFLSVGCTDWLLKQMGSYEHSAVTLYYWPDNMADRSSLFASVQSDLNQGMIKEELKNFWSQETLEKFHQQFPIMKDSALEEIEASIVTDVSQRQLVDHNTFFPVRLITGEHWRSLI